jgi:hypothetical protein
VFKILIKGEQGMETVIDHPFKQFAVPQPVPFFFAYREDFVIGKIVLEPSRKALVKQ